MLSKRHYNGFTLVELAIVLVIIGLVVSGILAGQFIIRQAELGGVIKDITYIRVAYKNFVNTFDAIPGDMDNAYDFWGADCDASAGNCNGDGNEQISWNNSTTNNEGPRAWQHISLAGMFPKSYSGTAVAGSSIAMCDPGVNVPKGAVSNTGWHPYYLSFAGLDNHMRIGRPVSAGGCADNTFTPAEVLSIDKKFGDDEQARAGKILTNYNGCYTGQSYNVSVTDEVCGIHVTLDN